MIDAIVKALRLVLVVLCAVVAAPGTEAAGVDDLDAGVEAFRLGKLDEAIRLYTNAIASGELRGESLARALHGRASAWDWKNDFDRAIADLNEVIRLNPRDADAFTARGNGWRNKKDFPRAIADYNEAIRLDPRDSYPFDRRGLAYLTSGNYPAAIADYNTALGIYPDSATSMYGRGVARRMMGDRAAAEIDIAAAKKKNAQIVEIFERYGIRSQ